MIQFIHLLLFESTSNRSFLGFIPTVQVFHFKLQRAGVYIEAAVSRGHLSRNLFIIDLAVIDEIILEIIVVLWIRRSVRLLLLSAHMHLHLDDLDI